jgi:hypothetical protein
MAINLTPLENAIARLEEMLARYGRESAASSVGDSVIKRLVTYEMTAKLIKVALQAASASPTILSKTICPRRWMPSTGTAQARVFCGLLKRIVSSSIRWARRADKCNVYPPCARFTVGSLGEMPGFAGMTCGS